jgi:hypothetical protein
MWSAHRIPQQHFSAFQTGPLLLYSSNYSVYPITRLSGPRPNSGFRPNSLRKMCPGPLCLYSATLTTRPQRRSIRVYTVYVTEEVSSNKSKKVTQADIYLPLINMKSKTHGWILLTSTNIKFHFN